MALVHTPCDGSSRSFAIGLRPLDPARWFEPDGDLFRDLAEKDALMEQRRAVVFGEIMDSRAAQAEALALVAAHMTTRHPDRWRREGEAITVGGRRVDLASDAPLAVAGRLTQDDLCLLQRDEAGWRLTAASLCFPSTWSLAEKLGRPMGAIHADVPGYAGRMAEMVQRIFDNLRVEQPVERFNWSIYGDDRLHHPETRADPARFPADAAILERATIRVERQTLSKLPASGAILFTIRIHVDPMAALARHPDGARLAAGLREQLLGLDPAQLAYKGLAGARERLAAALESLSGEG
ncbi:MAG: DUF3445 domain-containing protein [Methylobacteriaceae bacterium]|nr:DUF3445 domain-containing protein [Methylobacteriaceae bacterium]